MPFSEDTRRFFSENDRDRIERALNLVAESAKKYPLTDCDKTRSLIDETDRMIAILTEVECGQGSTAIDQLWHIKAELQSLLERGSVVRGGDLESLHYQLIELEMRSRRVGVAWHIAITMRGRDFFAERLRLLNDIARDRALSEEESKAVAVWERRLSEAKSDLSKLSEDLKRVER